MIRTWTYEGHTPGPWKLDDRIKEMYLGLEPDAMLMQDAPLLLAEVKRLNALIHNDNNWLKLNHPKVFDEMMMSKLFGDEEE